LYGKENCYLKIVLRPVEQPLNTFQGISLPNVPGLARFILSRINTMINDVSPDNKMGSEKVIDSEMLYFLFF